jgi:hypothetical protein
MLRNYNDVAAVPFARRRRAQPRKAAGAGGGLNQIEKDRRLGSMDAQ